ncbi:hypothetical protein RFI_17069, partial [Reticulomyxa filosa]
MLFTLLVYACLFKTLLCKISEGTLEVVNEDVDSSASEKVTVEVGTTDDLPKINVQSQMLWATPVEVLNLSTATDGIEPASFHQNLAKYGIEMYEQFVGLYLSNKIRMKGIAEDTPINDRFYHFQRHLFEIHQLHHNQSEKQGSHNIQVPFEVVQLQARIYELVYQYFYRYGVYIQLQQLVEQRVF